jgi:hypothetical protein
VSEDLNTKKNIQDVPVPEIARFKRKPIKVAPYNANRPSRPASPPPPSTPVLHPVTRTLASEAFNPYRFRSLVYSGHGTETLPALPRN